MFRITSEEKRIVLNRRRINAQRDETYNSFMGKLRNSINTVTDALRDLEDYMMSHPNLESALESDFDKMEKFVFDSKSLVKKMSRLNVVKKS